MLTLLALYGGLFLTALVAATLLPAQSELLLGTLLVQSGEPAWALITVATLGNSAGSASTRCRAADRGTRSVASSRPSALMRSSQPWRAASTVCKVR